MPAIIGSTAGYGLKFIPSPIIDYCSNLIIARFANFMNCSLNSLIISYFHRVKYLELDLLRSQEDS